MKKAISLLLVLSMLFALVACGNETNAGKDPDQTPSQSDEQTADGIAEKSAESGVVDIEDYPFDETRKSTANTDERYPLVEYAQSLSPTDWQPYNLQDNAKGIVVSMLYESLLYQVSANEFEGRLAKSWTEEDDTHVLVELYDYIKDSEGNPITADDVVFSYNLNVDSGYAYQFEDFQSVEKVDEYTVRFTWKQPLSMLTSFNYLLAQVAIVSEEAYKNHDFSREPVGTGPYVVTDFVTNAYVELEANDNYWQAEELTSQYAQRNVQTIRINFMSDATMQMIALENGTSICNPYLTTTDLPMFLEGGEYYGDYNLTSVYASQSQTLMCNCSEDSIMGDINMRLAVWHAIDSKGMVKALGEDVYLPLTVDSAPCAGDYQDEWDDIESYHTQYDPELAKEYLKKAGYKGENIHIITGSWGAKETIALVLNGMLSAVGINSTIEVVEFVNEVAVLSDTSAWDIVVTNAADSDYVVSRIWTLYSVEQGKSDPTSGLPTFKVYDEELESMIMECISPDGYSTELTEKILMHIIDNAYTYGVSCNISFFAWNPVVAKPLTTYGRATQPIFGSCEYYLD